MTAADQIAEINAQHAERVKLLERERDAKVAMVRGRCAHEWRDVTPFNPHNTDHSRMAKHVHQCKHCGAPMP